MLFDDLTPPPGGLAGLRVKLNREPRRAPFVLALVAACALCVIVWPRSLAPPPSDGLAAGFFAPAHATVTARDGCAALRVREDSKVAIYFAVHSPP